jgi:hypothetical protein
MNSNNVIKFPKEYGGPIIRGLSVSEIEENVNNTKLFHVQETVATLAPLIFNHFEISGFDLFDEGVDDEIVKDGALIVESIRSMLLKYYGLYHPFQQLSEHIFEPDDNTETDIEAWNLKIVDELNIVFGDSDTPEESDYV